MAPSKDPIHWLAIDDFTPGIYTRKYQDPSLYQPVLGPKGSASPVGTFGCHATPSGALAALPGYAANSSSKTRGGAGVRPVANPSVSRNAVTIAGIFVIPSVVSGGPPPPGYALYPEVHIVFDYLDNAGGAGQVNREMRWERYLTQELGTPYAIRDVVLSVGPLSDQAAATASPHGWGVDWGMSRIGNLPIVAMSWAETLGSPATIIVPNNDFLGYFPDDAAPNVTGVHGIDLNNAGRMITHGGRIIQFEVTPSQHGAGVGYLVNNELINYTDPAGSHTWPVQQSSYAPEENYGYGAFESVNAGELLLVKHRGGGVLISGDFNNPTVTRLPSVIGTGGYQTKGDATSIGFCYLTPMGMFVWRGGDQSELISPQLDPMFWHPANAQNATLRGMADMGGSLAQVESFGQYIFVTGGWIYDTITKSWWYLTDPTVDSWHYASSDGYNLFAAPSVLNSSTKVMWAQFRQDIPGTTFTWTSNLVDETTNRYLDIREVVLTAQSEVAGGQVGVTIIDALDGTTTDVVTFNLDASNIPRKYHAKCGVQTHMLQVKVVSVSQSGTASAPIIHGIEIGYEPAQTIATV